MTTTEEDSGLTDEHRRQALAALTRFIDYANAGAQPLMGAELGAAIHAVAKDEGVPVRDVVLAVAAFTAHHALGIDTTTPRKNEHDRRSLVRALRDPVQCRYDHHGYCQTHSLHPRPCPQDQARSV